MDFGAFVDIGLGSKDALLHISQLSVRTHVTLLHKLELTARYEMSSRPKLELCAIHWIDAIATVVTTTHYSCPLWLCL